MKQSLSWMKGSPRDRVEQALDLLDQSIGHEDFSRHARSGTVRYGLDAMASALIEWRSLGIRNAASLDEVLALLGANDDLVETTAQLIDLLGPVAYVEGPDEKELDEAEGLREELVTAIEEMLNDLDEEESEDSDA